MMTPLQLVTVSIEPCYTLLPERMRSDAATRMLVAIAIQESGLVYRQQVLRFGRRWWEWRGPARGWWQFEAVGLRGVLRHKASRDYAREIAATLGYETPIDMIPAWLSSLHVALKHNDTLAAAMARCLLWTVPHALPTTAEQGFQQYVGAWRPGAYWRGDAAKRAQLLDRWRRAWNAASY